MRMNDDKEDNLPKPIQRIFSNLTYNKFVSFVNHSEQFPK